MFLRFKGLAFSWQLDEFRKAFRRAFSNGFRKACRKAFLAEPFSQSQRRARQLWCKSAAVLEATQRYEYRHIKSNQKTPQQYINIKYKLVTYTCNIYKYKNTKTTKL